MGIERGRRGPTLLAYILIETATSASSKCVAIGINLSASARPASVRSINTMRALSCGPSRVVVPFDKVVGRQTLWHSPSDSVLTSA